MPPNPNVSRIDVAVQSRERVAQRPLIRRAEPYSSALIGMERTATRSRTPKSTGTIEAIIDMYGERPLPPVPRIPSSIYASSKRGTMISPPSPVSPESPGAIASPPTPATPSPISPLQIRSMFEKDSKSAKHLSQLFRKEPRGKANPMGSSPLRQNLLQKSKYPESPKARVKDTKPVPFTEWKPPTYREPSGSSKSSPRTPSQRSASFDSPRPSLSTWRTAEGRAASYFALIDPTNSLNREKSRRISSPPTKSPSFPFPDVRDASKQRTVPYPIRTNSLPETPPQSHFSPSSPSASDVEGSSGVASSLRSRAKKVLLPSKATKRPGLRQWMSPSQSDISCVSSMTNSSSSNLPSSDQRNSMQQSLSDVYDTLEKMSTQSRGGIVRPPLLRGDHSYPLTKKVPIRDLRSQVMALTENQKQSRKNQEASKNHPYVYRVPRKRLSRPKTPAVSMGTTTKGPDTTYKIEIPAPQTPQRPESALFFGDSYHIETSSSNGPNVSCHPTTTQPTRVSTTIFHHRSHSSSGSVSNHSRSYRVSKVEKHRMHRHSLPTSAHSRSNTDDSTLSRLESLALLSNTGVKNAGKPVEQKWKASLPMLGLAARELESADPLELERGRHRGRKDGRRGRPESGGTSISAHRRREALKKRIRIMGDPSAVGIPF